MKIGFIGLGIMGSKMAMRLASAGYELIANHLQVEAGQENYLGQFVEKGFDKAMVAGIAELDMSSIILLLEKETGVTVHKDSKEG